MKKNPKVTLRKLGILFLNFILFYALLRIIVTVGERTGLLWIYYAGTALYAAAVIVLFVRFFILNGFTLDRTEYEMEDLPAKWDDERKRRFLAELPANREKARRLVYFLLPLILTLLVSYIELVFFK